MLELSYRARKVCVCPTVYVAECINNNMSKKRKKDFLAKCIFYMVQNPVWKSSHFSHCCITFAKGAKPHTIPCESTLAYTETKWN